MQTCDETSSVVTCMFSRLAEISHHAWSVHFEGVREGSAVAEESSVSNQYQGDKVHRTVRRLPAKLLKRKWKFYFQAQMDGSNFPEEIRN